MRLQAAEMAYVHSRCLHVCHCQFDGTVHQSTSRHDAVITLDTYGNFSALAQGRLQ